MMLAREGFPQSEAQSYETETPKTSEKFYKISSTVLIISSLILFHTAVFPTHFLESPPGQNLRQELSEAVQQPDQKKPKSRDIDITVLV